MMWVDITDNASINKLMYDYCGFHDCCIVSVNYSSGAFVDENGGMGDGDDDEHTVSLIVHSQLRDPIELYFLGVKKCCITGFRERYFCDIFGATLSFRNDLLDKVRDDKLIVWADRENFDPKVYTERYPLDNGNEATYIIAKKLKYRFLNQGK